MIGLMILAVVFGYIFLSKFIINKVYKTYGTKKARNIALAIMILIPTWDVILGFPIYTYLCLFEAGTKIHKTVDNVEGFYVGKQSKNYEPYEPYKGYKYIDYKEEKSNKYYRSYWVNYWENTNASKLCVQPDPKYPNRQYAKVFKTGKCIVKKEISEGEVSGLWKISKKEIKNYHIFYLKISSIFVEVIDPRTDEKYFIATDWIVDNSWMTGMNIVTGTKSRNYCIGIGNNREYHIDGFFITNMIITKKGEK